MCLAEDISVALVHVTWSVNGRSVTDGVWSSPTDYSPSAVSGALPSLMQLLSDFNSNELVAFGDLNWNWLQPVSDDFRAYCDSLNLFQIVDSPTRPNFKNPEKSSLIDVILTNVPHKYSTASIFANDISDHCVVATVRNTKIPKIKPRIIVKRNMKHFSGQEFLHDLSNYDWEKNYISAEVDSAWNLFHEGFTNIINKYAPLKKYRVKGRNNAWFSPDLANILHERNVAWAKARKSNQNSDWLVFRQLRNACTLKIRKAKADHFLSQTTHNLNNPSKFWKTIKSLSENSKGQELPSSIVIDSQKLTDKTKILDCFNEHFIAS